MKRKHVCYHQSILLFLGSVLTLLPAWCGEETAFVDESEAHALYDKMVQTMRDANSLSWMSEYQNEFDGNLRTPCRYHIWLKKPNYARIEMISAMNNQLTGVLVGDGDYFYIYWPNGKPRYGWEYKEPYCSVYEEHRYTFYDKKRTPVGMHSLGHDIGDLGGGMGMSAVPMTYVIDREGKVVRAWYGYGGSHHQGINILKQLGVDVSQNSNPTPADN